MLIKNQTIICRILRSGYSAEGIAEIDGLIVFVENALPDEFVEIKIIKLTKNYAVGKLLKVIEPSEYRIADFCKNSKCGGCQLTFVSYDYQLKLKENIILSAFRQNAKLENLKLNPAISAQHIFHYRNKVIMPVAKKEDGAIEIGFFSGRSHRVVNIDGCKLQPEITDKIIKAVKKYLIENNISVYNENAHKGIFRNLMIRVNHDLSELMITPVINADKLPAEKKIVEALLSVAPAIKSIVVCINKNKGNTLITDNLRLIYGDDFITTRLLDKYFLIRPNTFFQVNYKQTEKLYDYTRRLVKQISNEFPNKPVIFDLYAGVSAIGVCLADLAEIIYSIEENPAAADLSYRICELNNIKNLKHITADTSNAVNNLISAGVKPDIVIFDPPRKGCAKDEIELLAQIVRNIIYISCNPATLARDAAVLIAAGFEINQIQPVDMFPNTYHIETICVFTKKNSACKDNHAI